MKKNISKDMIIRKSFEMIEKEGYDHFSMRELAKNLGIRTASLYNHVENLDEIKVELAMMAIDRLNIHLKSSLNGRDNEADLINLAFAYRSFTRLHGGIYKIVLEIGLTNNPELHEYGYRIAEPIFEVLERFRLNTDEVREFQRLIRSTIHGFISLEEAGFFSHIPTATDMDKSFRACMENIILAIRVTEKKGL